MCPRPEHNTPQPRRRPKGRGRRRRRRSGETALSPVPEALPPDWPPPGPRGPRGRRPWTPQADGAGERSETMASAARPPCCCLGFPRQGQRGKRKTGLDSSLGRSETPARVCSRRERGRWAKAASGPTGRGRHPGPKGKCRCRGQRRRAALSGLAVQPTRGPEKTRGYSPLGAHPARPILASQSCGAISSPSGFLSLPTRPVATASRAGLGSLRSDVFHRFGSPSCYDPSLEAGFGFLACSPS